MLRNMRAHEDKVTTLKDRFQESLQKTVQNVYHTLDQAIDQAKEFFLSVPILVA